MMEKEQLRKADVFSGSAVMLLGLWIISQALKMPMKDSWGGVQNVWFVSPALFPLLVGGTIVLLGGLLIRTALKEIGGKALKQALQWLGSSDLVQFLKTASLMRFYAMVALFFSFVYLNIPRVDFFLCSVLFLKVFISMFYFEDDALLKKMLVFYLCGTILFLLLVVLGLSNKLEAVVSHPNDWYTLLFVLGYILFAGRLVWSSPALRKKFATSLILSVATPFIIGPIFKYLLMVPMPTEGLVVTVLDAIWYWDF